MEQRVLNFHSVLRVSGISKPVGTSWGSGPGWVSAELCSCWWARLASGGAAGTAALCSIHPRVVLGNVDVWPVSLSRKREELDSQISLLARGTCARTELETLMV